MKKTTLIAGAMTVAMMTTAAVPMSVSAKAKVTAPAKVSVTSVKRVNNTKSTVTWKKLKKNTSGYAVYVKKGSNSWKETKKVGAKTTSVTFVTGVNDKYQVKVRAYKNGKKVKKYYNKKTKKFVSKKAYKKLAKKNRTTKKVAVVKWGKYSSAKTLNTVFSGQVKIVNASFNKDEDVSLSWNKVGGVKKYEIYRSEGGNYKLVDSVTGTSYVDKYYNPTKEIYYKVRPVNGAFTGAYSSEAKLNPNEGHQWKETTESVDVLSSWKKTTEQHDICLSCVEMGRKATSDIETFSLGVVKCLEWDKAHPDATYEEYKNNPYYAIYKKSNDHDDRDDAEYASGENKSGSMTTHNTWVDVDIYTPIKKTTSVTKYTCSDCGKTRMNQKYTPFGDAKCYALVDLSGYDGLPDNANHIVKMTQYADGTPMRALK